MTSRGRPTTRSGFSRRSARDGRFLVTAVLMLLGVSPRPFGSLGEPVLLSRLWSGSSDGSRVLEPNDAPAGPVNPVGGDCISVRYQRFQSGALSQGVAIPAQPKMGGWLSRNRAVRLTRPRSLSAGRLREKGQQ